MGILSHKEQERQEILGTPSARNGGDDPSLSPESPVLCGCQKQKQERKKQMKKLMIVAACAAIVAGCGTPGKVRDIDLKGMYINGYSETLAIGQGKITSIPGEREAMAAHYEEDVAWLSPQKKTHSLDIFLVGSNTVQNSAQIVKSICEAFRDVAPTVSSDNAAASGSTVFDYLTAAGKRNSEIETAKAAEKTALTNATTSAAIPANLKESITKYFADRGGDAAKARLYYDANNVLTMTDGNTTVECAADGQCRECGDK